MCSGNRVRIRFPPVQQQRTTNNKEQTTTTTTTTTIISSQGHPVFSRQRAHIRYGFLPHLVGGNDIVRSLLFSAYPAIPPYVVRTPHPGMTDDREHISRQHSRAWTEREREREREKGERGRVWGLGFGVQVGSKWLYQRPAHSLPVTHPPKITITCLGTTLPTI